MLVLAPAGGVEVDVDVFDAAVARARDTGTLVDHLAALRRYDARPALIVRCAGAADVILRSTSRAARTSSSRSAAAGIASPDSRPATTASSSTCRA